MKMPASTRSLFTINQARIRSRNRSEADGANVASPATSATVDDPITTNTAMSSTSSYVLRSAPAHAKPSATTLQNVVLIRGDERR